MVIVVALVALTSAACGARLSDQQLTAARASADAAAGQDAGSDRSTGSGPDDPVVTGDPNIDGSTATTAAAGPGSGSGSSGGTKTTTAAGSAAGASSAAAPAGGNGGATDVGVTANTITIGNVSTLTGPVPGIFAGATVGTQAFYAYQNSKGGLFGRKFKVDARDDQFDTGQNRTQTVDLIGKAFAMSGSFSLFDDAPVEQLKASNVPDVSHALGFARVKVPNNFSIQPGVPGGPTGPMNWFKTKYPEAVKAVGSVYGDVPSAKALHQSYRAAAESVGYKFLYERGFSATETDFTSDVVRMRDSGVKLVYLFSVDEKTSARFAKAMKSQGFKPEAFAVNGTGYDADAMALGGEALEGMFIPLSTSLYGGEDSAVIPEVKLFNEWVQKVKPGFKPDIFTLYGWTSGRLLVQAMEQVGPKVTRDAVNAAIRKIGDFDSNGMIAPSNPGAKKPATCFIMARVTGGKYVRHDSPRDSFRCNEGDWFHTQ